MLVVRIIKLGKYLRTYFLLEGTALLFQSTTMDAEGRYKIKTNYPKNDLTTFKKNICTKVNEFNFEED